MAKSVQRASLPLFLLLVCLGTVASRSNVRHLPGFSGSLPFELETGYIGADEDDDVQLFYYFIKSERNPAKDPLILWLSGGPGCTSFYGLAYETGPLTFKKVKYDGTLPTLELNPHSWTKVANIIFLDAPVGTGFSYSNTLQASLTGDTKSAIQTYTALRKWFIDHPEFLSNPFYISGDSYIGVVIPLLVLEVSDGNKGEIEPAINLKGYTLGNPLTDWRIDNNGKIPFAHGMGLISDELYESLKRNCKEEYYDVDPSNKECHKDLEAFSECVSGLEISQILEPKCLRASPKPNENTGGLRRSLNDNSSKVLRSPPPVPGFECRSYVRILSYHWANDDRVQEALNVRKGKVQEWLRCNHDLPYTADIVSSIEHHASLSKRGYRSLIYSGDHDLTITFKGTEAWIKSLNYSIVDDWRPWTVDAQVAGYTRTYANKMSFVTVKGGGHTAPEYKPKECFAMFDRWISRNPL
ncbi:hypothetical protein Sjap_022656 [Stephania japonica]|uniref:Uncharacterized protein n=1 Tax=Stephania japonica TaxID=461633 RepID=A0AAP0EPS3_9MAGN